MLIDPSEINIDNYNYNLPDNRIALYPLKNRDNSKLLIYNIKARETAIHDAQHKNNTIQESLFYNITDYFLPDTLLIFNNTKVIQARLLFKKKSGADIEIFCLEPFFPHTEMNSAFQQTSSCQWNCLVGNAKRWKEEELKIKIPTQQTGGKTSQVFKTCEVLSASDLEKQTIELTAKKIKATTEGFIVEFRWQPQSLNFSEILEIFGVTPLPPYIKRQPEESDKRTYQTIYAKEDGSVAAPTAGLHFTESVMEKLKQNKIKTEYLTLHVSTGTFKPVTSQTIDKHYMHSEVYSINKSTLLNIINNLDKNIIPVGTTSLRTIESLYWTGVKMIVDKNDNIPEVEQWDAYEEKYNNDISTELSLASLLKYMEQNNLETIQSSTSIIIIPGYRFRIIKGLITNLHQPKSTLLLLIAALIGEHWKTVYDYALAHDFRFLSYGDSCLFI